MNLNFLKRLIMYPVQTAQKTDGVAQYIPQTDDEFVVQYIDLIVRSLTFLYPEDHSCPSLLISRLKHGSYYVSLVRYEEPYGKSKRVLFNTSQLKLKDALKQSANFVVNHTTKKSPVDQLKELIDSGI